MEGRFLHTHKLSTHLVLASVKTERRRSRHFSPWGLPLAFHEEKMISWGTGSLWQACIAPTVCRYDTVPVLYRYGHLLLVNTPSRGTLHRITDTGTAITSCSSTASKYFHLFRKSGVGLVVTDPTTHRKQAAYYTTTFFHRPIPKKP